ncbi:hypothetical protein OBBRIDRAFT_780872 [Obba rivulosa]|uniref:SMODS and SLOG-associating 2TM effector domain-containing protein n=1 Tax=Obba rivulosa TaxID=1052685 RepID=A0A8E2ATD1_9APHY|nr:hypothetical protein OBBRIDRAFT_780872 [Obba rivulosa]
METGRDDHAPPAQRPTDMPEPQTQQQTQPPREPHEDTTPLAMPQPQPQHTASTRMPAPGVIRLPSPHPQLPTDPSRSEPVSPHPPSIMVPSPTGGAAPFGSPAPFGSAPLAVSQAGTPRDSREDERDRPLPPPPERTQTLQPPAPVFPMPRDPDLRSPLGRTRSYNGQRDSGYEGSGIRQPGRTLSYNDGRGYADPKLSRRTTNGSMLVENLHPNDAVAREGMASRRSVLDWVIPHSHHSHAGDPNNGIPPISAQDLFREKTVRERLLPTLEHAQAELEDAKLKAKMTGYALNAAIGAQVLLGALTTGVAAATSGRHASIATSVLGGISTLAASYLARARGSGEPEHSALRCRDLENYIRDLEAYMLDKGHLVGDEYDPMIDRYRRRFEEVLGNASTGVGNTIADNTKAPRKSGETQVESKNGGKLSEKSHV